MKRFLLHEPPAIRISRFAGGAGYGFILDELEPRGGTGAYAVVEAARDLGAWIERMDGGETVGEREIRRRLRTAPTEFAQEADAEASPADPPYACELGRVPAAAPEHEQRGAWLTWADLQARHLGRWDVAVRALDAHAERALRRGEAVPAARLRRLAGIAGRRRRHAALPLRAATPPPVPHTR